MSSANSFLPSTAYHASNTRYSTSQTATTTVSSSSFNILSNNVQQQLNDLNSTRSSTSSCSTSHCLSNQCLECTTILSTRPSQSRCILNSYIDSSSNSAHFVQNCSYVASSTLDSHPQISTLDDQQTTRILSMNIPVDNSNNHINEVPTSSSTLNIEIEEDDDDDEQQTPMCNEHSDENEQLEVFVGFYRPGEYQRETMEEEEDDEDEQRSDASLKSDAQKKEEQSIRELISDDDEGNEDQDFIDEDFGPNQDEDTDQIQPDNENISEETLNPNILDHDQQQQQQQQQQQIAYQIAASGQSAGTPYQMINPTGNTTLTTSQQSSAGPGVVAQQPAQLVQRSNILSQARHHPYRS